ncbi:hypothetical protein [Streptomyces tailanensis]|uniref:hypothetical protein n=1 Tax=Streptomyces tailanensis TaxID=2569858 RepID=UPI00122E7E8A|nr:hypothetical protein [Streptomyces tailanensis]
MSIWFSSTPHSAGCLVPLLSVIAEWSGLTLIVSPPLGEDARGEPGLLRGDLHGLLGDRLLDGLLFLRRPRVARLRRGC